MKTKVIAEIGCNHKGDFDTAKEMIRVAKAYCNVDIVKFQKRCNRELLSDQEYNAPHPNPANSYGSTYGEHREALEFSKEQHHELKKYCDDLHVEYSTSVWDLTSAKQIVDINPKIIKIPSACNTNFGMLQYLVDHFNGEIHISLGMTSESEYQSLIEFVNKQLPVSAAMIVPYACTSGYPVDFKDVCLRELTRIKNDWRTEYIGFSGHHLGIAIDNAAVALGAVYIERHFTLDRTWKGTDHAASLEPDGMRKLVRDIRATEAALTYKTKDILDIEEPQRRKLKRL